MLAFIKKALLAGAGLAVVTTEKVKELLDELVKKGEISEQEAREALAEISERLRESRKDFEERVEGAVKSLLGRLDVPERKELEELRARIEKLEQERREG